MQNNELSMKWDTYIFLKKSLEKLRDLEHEKYCTAIYQLGNTKPFNDAKAAL